MVRKNLSVARVIAEDAMVAMKMDPSDFRTRDTIITAINPRLTDILDQISKK